MTSNQYAERKALLVAQARLDRTRLVLAAQEIRSLVAPKPSAATRAAMRSKAALLVALALPILGSKRLHRFARFVSYSLMVIRVVRNWRRDPTGG